MSHNRVKIKICGITNIEDAKLAVQLGADALGFNFCKDSKRFISAVEAKAITRQLPPNVWMVGVFVNSKRSEVEHIAREAGLDTLQFHGDEPVEYLKDWSEWRIIKAIRVKNETSIEGQKDVRELADFVLLDAHSEYAYGGTGKEIGQITIEKLRGHRILQRAFLAGGLTPENVQEKIQLLNPFGVDVAGGVESDEDPRKKDPEKLKAFFQAVQG
jgi:phosphoribosylanthranilate isomerase